MGFKTVEPVSPFGMRAAQPVVHRKQAFELKSRRTALTIAAADDQPRVFQNLQVLGDGWLRQGGSLGKFEDSGLT